MTIPVTIIFHLPSNVYQDQKDFDASLDSIKNINAENFDCIAISSGNELLSLSGPFKNIEVIRKDQEPAGEWLNKAFMSASGRRILYIDNQKTRVVLKKGTLQIFQMAMDRNADAGMVYGDYTSLADDSEKPIRLLKHHKGRVRDNQDYGNVLFFRRGTLREIGFFDSKIDSLPFYDLRLRLSEISTLVHIGNRSGGSLYSVNLPPSSQNVFDYLLAKKEVQLEAERILSSHLKRIGSWLPPGWNYTRRPKPADNKPLKASIIIPVNNRPDFISTAIKSVQAQTVKEIEIVVVVNGGHNDPTCNEVRRFMDKGDLYNPCFPQVRLIVTDINNIGFCVNLGLLSARGEYYVQLDSDDRLKIDAVEKILDVFQSDETIGMVIGSYDVWEKKANGSIERLESIHTVTHDEWTEENGRNNLLRINGAGAPRSVPVALAEEIGYFGINEQPHALNYGEDYELVLKISERYRIGRVWDPIYDVIRHPGGTDHSIDQETMDRNDEAKDHMRLNAIKRRKKILPPENPA